MDRGFAAPTFEDGEELSRTAPIPSALRSYLTPTLVPTTVIGLSFLALPKADILRKPDSIKDLARRLETLLDSPA